MKILAVTAAITVALVATSATLSSDTKSPTGKITLTAVQLEHHAFFPGETWRYSLSTVRRSAKRPFGYMVMVCIRISHANTLRQCSGTVSLPRGKIIIAGSFLYPIIYRFAITGGTDDYAGTKGQVTITQLHGSRFVYTLTFVLQ